MRMWTNRTMLRCNRRISRLHGGVSCASPSIAIVPADSDGPCWRCSRSAACRTVFSPRPRTAVRADCRMHAAWRNPQHRRPADDGTTPRRADHDRGLPAARRRIHRIDPACRIAGGDSQFHRQHQHPLPATQTDATTRQQDTLFDPVEDHPHDGVGLSDEAGEGAGGKGGALSFFPLSLREKVARSDG